jgi:hypothetical protein
MDRRDVGSEGGELNCLRIGSIKQRGVVNMGVNLEDP